MSTSLLGQYVSCLPPLPPSLPSLPPSLPPFLAQSAGYTLQELLHLTRSSVLQQRVLSITTLAKVMERVSFIAKVIKVRWCGRGGEVVCETGATTSQCCVVCISVVAFFFTQNQRNEFAGVLDHSPTRSLIDAGLPLVLRYSLDEGSLAMMSAAVQATHSLLVVDNEEVS